MKRRAISLVAFAIAVGSASLADERFDYVLHCAGCHKLDGSGSTAVPALDEIGRLIALPGGREYIGRVPGVAQAPLSDERLAALLNWLVAERGGVAVPPYEAAEVAALRSRPLRDPLAARAALMKDGNDQRDCKDCKDGKDCKD